MPPKLAGRIYPTRNRDVDHEANWFSDRWPVANELLEGQIQRFAQDGAYFYSYWVGTDLAAANTDLRFHRPGGKALVRPVERVAWSSYDRMLKSQGVEEGVKSYSRVIQLLIGTDALKVPSPASQPPSP